MAVTPHINLTKPAYTDPADIAVLNTNFDNIDSAVHGNRQMFGYVEETNLATTNHSIGEIIVWGGQLAKVTANIAQNDTIVANTNVTITTLSEIIADIVSQL